MRKRVTTVHNVLIVGKLIDSSNTQDSNKSSKRLLEIRSYRVINWQFSTVTRRNLRGKPRLRRPQNATMAPTWMRRESAKIHQFLWFLGIYVSYDNNKPCWNVKTHDSISILLRFCHLRASPRRPLTNTNARMQVVETSISLYPLLTTLYLLSFLRHNRSPAVTIMQNLTWQLPPFFNAVIILSRSRISRI